MKFKAEIDQLRTLKKGCKITLYLDEDNTASMLQRVHNFHDKPLKVEILIDAAEQIERLGRISEDQRKKIYSIFRDISESTGNDTETTKHFMKQMYTEGGRPTFSFSDCPKELAQDFIEWLIGWCFENGVPLSDHPQESFEDDEGYLRLCIDKKLCCICGNIAEIHHWNAIGMGRDRRHYDDSDHRKMALCHIHHREIEQIGRDTFAEKYHVTGVKA